MKPPAAWEAYDYYLQGTRAYWLGFTESSVASTYEARRLLEKSLSIDPNYARAYAILARSYVATYLEPRDGDYLLAAGLERAHEFATEKPFSSMAVCPKRTPSLDGCCYFKGGMKRIVLCTNISNSKPL